MKKWNRVDSAVTPDGQTLTLFEHDGSYSLRVDGAELMSTRKHASEEQLARLACEPVSGRPRVRVLIGGLGFGYTLRAALSVLGQDAAVVVAELIPAVIQWNRNPAYNLAHDVLQDRRVRLIEKDVFAVLTAERIGYDSIMLDIDNGPAAMVSGSNRELYIDTGLQLVRAALRPGGCVAFWSAQANPLFAKKMSRAGFQVDVQRARAHATGGSWHTIFVGRVPASG